MRFLRTVIPVFAAVALFGFQQADPWRANELFDAATIAAELKSKPADQPLILQVGFESLYKSVRIPHSGSTPGQARRPEGHRQILNKG